MLIFGKFFNKESFAILTSPVWLSYFLFLDLITPIEFGLAGDIFPGLEFTLLLNFVLARYLFVGKIYEIERSVFIFHILFMF